RRRRRWRSGRHSRGADHFPYFGLFSRTSEGSGEGSLSDQGRDLAQDLAHGFGVLGILRGIRIPRQTQSDLRHQPVTSLAPAAATIAPAMTFSTRPVVTPGTARPRAEAAA